ncbi:MAG: glycoside hydrolase family 88 protein [Halobacteriaceae archaeon]
MRETLTETVRRVADHLVDRDMENEDWEKGAAVNGLLATGGDAYVAEARRIVDRAVETQTAEGKFNYDDPKPWMHGEDPYRAQCEPATLGHGVLSVYERTGEERYLEAARRQYEYLRDDAQRTADGGIAYSTGPVELWVDSVYMVCPFFARYADLADDPEAYDEAVTHVEVQARHLQDPHTGLFRHEWRERPDTYPESSLWARGNGWALAGALDTLLELPEDHDGYETVRDVFTTQAAALLDRQDETGLWHHILDYPESPLETSATLQYSYAFARGHEAGLLDEAYADAAERAFGVCRNVVDGDGRVRRVAVPPGGPDAPLGVTSYGQGWFLLAADQQR